MKIIILLLSAGLLFTGCKTSREVISAGNCADSDNKSISEKLSLSSSQTGSQTGVCSLDDGVTSITSRAWLCDHAQKTLDVQYYIFSKDNVGLIASDFLVRAADRGVKVRLLIDDITVKAGSREIFTLDSHENIEIKIYNPGVKFERNLITRLIKIFTRFDKLHRRMHVKSLTVDDQVTIVGGRNIADEYYDYDKRYNFRDRDILLIGKEVKQVKKTFELYWNDTLSVPFRELVRGNKKKARDPRRFDKLHAYACDPANFSTSMRKKIKQFPDLYRSLNESGQLVWTDQVYFVADGPSKTKEINDKQSDVCTDSLLHLIKEAKNSIDIQSPYVIPMEQGLSLLKETLGRGVRVRILTNSLASTDNDEAFSGYHRDRPEIAGTAVELYEFRPDAQVRYKLMNPDVQAAISYSAVYGLHSKTMLVDDHITVIGSYNADPRSVNINTECIVIVRSRDFNQHLRTWIEEEIKPENAWRITPNFNPDAEAGTRKRIKNFSRKVVPKNIL